MHAGRRYDAFMQLKAGPPLPPLLICAPADPFASSPRFLEDVKLLSQAVTVGKPTPDFIPLGQTRTGERLEYCEPSGGPQSASMLPIAQMWRAVFGTMSTVPLWLGYTPGAVFAVSREAILRTRGDDSAVNFYRRLLITTRLGEDSCVDPITRGQAFSRLWRFIFVAEGADK